MIVGKFEVTGAVGLWSWYFVKHTGEDWPKYLYKWSLHMGPIVLRRISDRYCGTIFQHWR